MWTGNLETSGVGLCINWQFTYSATQRSIFGHKMVSKNINAKEKARFHVICGSERYRSEE